MKLQYVVNDKPITNPSVNKLAGVAYFHTKGVDDRPRVGVERLREVLVELGVSDPKEPFAAVTLPNGKTLAAQEIPPSASPSTVEARPADSAPQSDTASLGAEPLVTIGEPNFRNLRSVDCAEHGHVGGSQSASEAREIAYRHAATVHAGAQGVVAS